jgi:anti-sigma B factor antagonist
MDIDTHDDGKEVTIRPRGRMTLGESDRLCDAVIRLVEEGHRQLAIDLGGLAYIDSAGLGSLVSSFSFARRRAANIRIVNARPPLSDLLDRTKLL